MSECIGWTDSSHTERCAEPVVCEVRIARGGDKWHPWRPVCEQHGTALMKILTEADGWDAERRNLKGGKK